MIIQKNDTRTIPQIFGVTSVSEIYDSTVPGVFTDDPVWVLIDGVYASLIVTGDTSWRKIVKSSTDNFTVIGGRHGNQINPIGHNGYLDPRDLATDINDAAHIKGDLQLAVEFASRVTILDVNLCHHLRNKAGLQREVNRITASGGKVIFSWCYGIYTYCESVKVKRGEDVSNPSHPEHTLWKTLMNYSVAELVDKYWPH